VPLGPGGYKDESGELIQGIQPADYLAIRNRVNADDDSEIFLRKMLNAYAQGFDDKITALRIALKAQDTVAVQKTVRKLSLQDYAALMQYARLLERRGSHVLALRTVLNEHPALPYGPDESGETPAQAKVVPLKAVRREIPELADEQVARPEDPLAKHFVAQMDLLCMSADALVLADAIVAADQTAATGAIEAASTIQQATKKMFCEVLNTLPRVCELAKKDAGYRKLASDSTAVLAKIAELLLSTKAPVKDGTAQN
jgi:hypothetical protein